MADQYETEFNVTEGPSKFDLMSALFANCDTPIKVTFTIQQRVPGTTKLIGAPYAVSVAIDSVEREDGSGESWNIRGWVTGSGKRYKCYYTTRRRTGWFALLKK